MPSPLKSQVVNLELSKRLKELGVLQKSTFSWSAREGIDGKIDDDAWHLTLTPFYEGNENLSVKNYAEDCDYHISAFLVGELGEMLKKDSNAVMFNDDTKKWGISISVLVIREDTEANARAKMLIYLLENNLIKSSDL